LIVQHRVRWRHAQTWSVRALLLLCIVLIVGMIPPSFALQSASAIQIDLPTTVLTVAGRGEGAIWLRCPTGGCDSVSLTLANDPALAVVYDVRGGDFWSVPPSVAVETRTGDDGLTLTTIRASGVPAAEVNAGAAGVVFRVTFEGLSAGTGALMLTDTVMPAGIGIISMPVEAGTLIVLDADTPSVSLASPIAVWLGPNTLFKMLGMSESAAPLPLLGISADSAWAFVSLPQFPRDPTILLPLDNRVWVEANDPAITAFNGDLSTLLEVVPTNTPTFTPTNTPTATPTATFTPSDTPTPTFTPSDTPTPTFTPSDTPTATFTPSDTPTPTFTPSDTPTPTSTFTPTLSDVEIAATNAAISAATATADAAPTRTQEALNTQLAQRLTEIALSWTPTPTASPTPTPTFTPSNTTTPSNTPSNTPIPTSTPEPAFVTSSSAVNLRAGDGQSYSIVGSFPVGGQALVLGRSNLTTDWLFILLPDGTRAWVSRGVVTRVSGDIDETPLVEAGTNRVFTNTPAPLRTPSATPFTVLDCSGFVPILPVNGFANGVEAFSWSGVNGIDTYRVVIYDADDNIVWTQNVTGTNADIDVSSTAIGPGINFSWQVIVLVNGLPECETFRVTLPRSMFSLTG